MMNLLFLAHSNPLDFKDVSAHLGHVLHVLPGVLDPRRGEAWRLAPFPPAPKPLLGGEGVCSDSLYGVGNTLTSNICTK